MSSYKLHLKISNNILEYIRRILCNVMLYCKESDVNVKKELDFINFSFLKHNLVSLGFYPFNVKEIISIRGDYFSTFTFTFSKQ